MRIQDVYRPEVISCEPADPLPIAAATMSRERVGAVAVVDGTLVVGILTEHDVTRAVGEHGDVSDVAVSDYVTTELRTARLSEDTHDVARRMLQAGVRHLPVVGDHTVVGMLSIRDLLAIETFV